MKLLSCLALFLVLATVSPSLAVDSQGRATFVVPNTYSQGGTAYQRSWLVLSNITESDITVKVRFFLSNATVLTDTDNAAATGVVRGVNVTNYSDTTTGLTATFDIAAGQTAECGLFPSQTDFGWGIVEWKQTNSEAAVALLGIVWRESYTSSIQVKSESVVTINNGDPF